MGILLAIGSVVAAVILIRIWTGAMNVKAVEEESLASIEKRHPYLPKLSAVLVSGVIAGGLFLLSLKYGTKTSLQSLTDSSAIVRSGIVFVAIVIFGMFEQRRWRGKKDRAKYFFAFVLGTLVTWILIAFKRAFFEAGITEDPFLMALGITCVVVGWRFLFGPWSASIKATVLGTFLFWTAYAMLRFETREELLATGIAAFFAVIPVIIWCMLFLSYHRERISVVLLALFAGMLSTVPILFYSELATRNVELNFFVFKVIPVYFGTSSKEFVTTSVLSGASGTQSIVLTALITYVFVGIVEELSKYWVLRHSSKEFFRSIDDVLQLAIIVAIGFAFAENIANPTYFVGFVKQHLLTPQSPEWGPFFGGVIGRSVLTMMVHILSTGVLGYFFGIAFFASPLIREQFSRGKIHPVISSLHELLALKTEHIFARYQLVLGLTVSIILHGVFDFVVSLPEVLPGNPATVGALLGSDPSSFYHNLSIVMLPAALYVVGGFWLLSYLFERKDALKEFGQIVETQTLVQ